MELQDPPLPWRFVTSYTIAALQDIGYAFDSDLLLIVSNERRLVINGLNGETLAEDTTIEQWKFDRVHLTIAGTGPLLGQVIRLAGKHGGGLPRYSSDEWRLDAVSVGWPFDTVLLVAPVTDDSINMWLPADPFDLTLATKVGPDRSDTVIAYGFSETGQTFVIATPSSIEIFSRAAS